MKLNKIFLKVFLPIVILILIVIFLSSNFSPLNKEVGTSYFDYVKSKISWKSKENIIRYILPYKYIDILENEIIKKEKIIDEKNLQISELKNDEIFELYNAKNFNKKVKIKYFKNPNFVNYGPRSYFAKNMENLFLVSGTTNTYYTQITNLENFNEMGEKVTFKKIPNNLMQILGRDYILDNETISKGAEIINDEIFISLVKKKGNDCHTNSIFKAKISTEFLNFVLFFDTEMCIPYFDNSSGGNIVNYKNQKLLITIGDWVWVNEEIFPLDSNLNPQDKDDFLGKILSIDLNNPKEVKMIAMGTRNSQGMFYDKINDLIFFSDHGPQGGDEINVIKPKDKLPNFGWPIVSYGEHYGFPENKNIQKYNRAPLKKPHIDYGFIEPLKYFPLASPAVSQIIKTNKFENYDDENIIIYQATLGDSNYGSKSVFKFELNKKLEILNEEMYVIDERVRDMIYLEQINKIIIYLETSGSIALLESN